MIADHPSRRVEIPASAIAAASEAVDRMREYESLDNFTSAAIAEAILDAARPFLVTVAENGG